MDDRFVVLLEYFESKHEDRKQEIVKSIEMNCGVPQVKRVIIFIDPEVEFPPSLKRVLSKENYDKIELHHTEPGGRSTYADFFSYANEHLVGENCILCNNDISFDETLDHIRLAEDFDLEGHFICLTRWDSKKDGGFELMPLLIKKNGLPNESTRARSHDSWIFKSPLPAKMLERGKFCTGIPGCDNMICYLAVVSGLKVFNPSELVVSRHTHLSGRRTYSDENRIGYEEEYAGVYPTGHIHYDIGRILYRRIVNRKSMECTYWSGEEAIKKILDADSIREVSERYYDAIHQDLLEQGYSTGLNVNQGVLHSSFSDFKSDLIRMLL